MMYMYLTVDNMYKLPYKSKVLQLGHKVSNHLDPDLEQLPRLLFSLPVLFPEDHNYHQQLLNDKTIHVLVTFGSERVNHGKH